MTDLTVAVIAIIVAGVALITAAVLLFVLHYHQILLMNEINKRLSLMTSESIERERMTMQEYQEALQQMESRPQVEEPTPIKYEEGFNPHNYTAPERGPLDTPMDSDDDE